MKLNYVTLKSITDELKELIYDNHISNITIINSHDILFTFSMYRKRRLLISLNHQCPFVSLIGNYETVITTNGQLNDVLRKDIRDGIIQDISLLNEDKIMVITITKSNDFYEKETKKIILELIPHKSNLIITNDKDVILFALHQTTLEASRPILRGLLYIAPNKSDNYRVDEEIYDINSIQKEAERYLLDAKETKLYEKYEPLFKYIKSKIKSLSNKKKVLLKETNRAKEELVYQEIGNTLLALSCDQEELDKYIKENNIDYDHSLSVGVNANNYFKMYKKAKRTIEMDNLEYIKADQEIERLEVTLAQAKFMSDNELLGLAKELMPYKFKVNVKITSEKISYIECNNTKIYFGKSSKQNDYLTFKFAKKEHYYFHIKDYHGSHVVVASDKLDNELILLASEMCLILSNKTTGDIIYNQIKEIKKGGEQGLALLNTYKLITLRNVREETIFKLKHSKQ